MKQSAKTSKKHPSSLISFKRRVTSLRNLYHPDTVLSFETRKIGEEDNHHLRHAKKLHAKIYLERTFIDSKDVGKDGTIHHKADPHQNHADYFVVVDKDRPNKVLATARQIKTVDGHDDLPVLVQARISKRSYRNILKVTPEHCIEISGLAKNKDVPSEASLELYRSMWLYSIEHGHKYWLMACDVKLYKRLKILFGNSIRRIGRQTSYKGGDIIPCLLDLDKSHIVLTKNLKSRHPMYGKIRRNVAHNFLRRPVAHP